jgi:hypothetical protein
MNVREYFNSLRTEKRTINELHKLMTEQKFQTMETPDGIKVTKLVKWCQEHLGHDNFVICQNTIFFDDTASMIQYKMMCPVEELRRRQY